MTKPELGLDPREAAWAQHQKLETVWGGERPSRTDFMAGFRAGQAEADRLREQLEWTRTQEAAVRDDNRTLEAERDAALAALATLTDVWATPSARHKRAAENLALSWPALHAALQGVAEAGEVER